MIISFDEVFDKYKNLNNSLYKKIYKKVNIDRDTFRSQFYYILFKAYKSYKKDFISTAHNNEDKLNRYIAASLTKMIISMKRQTIKNKYKTENNTVYLDGEILDHSCVNPYSEVAIKDLLQYSKDTIQDKGVLEMKYQGISKKDICQELNLTVYEYNEIVKKIRNDNEIKSIFCNHLKNDDTLM